MSSLDEEQCHHTVNNKVNNTLQYTSYKCTTVYVASSTLVIKTVFCLLLHHTKFGTCNLYNNISVKSSNQFLQCTYSVCVCVCVCVCT